MGEDPTLIARRIRAVGTNPVLMTRHMERLSAIERDMADIIELRLRTQHPDDPPADISEQAQVITHLLAGLIRYIGQSWARQAEEGRAPQTDPADITVTLQQALAKLG